MRALTLKQIERFLESLRSEYEIYVPVLLDDGSRALAPIGQQPLALAGGHVAHKPNSVFFPQFEDVFEMNNEGAISTPRPYAKPIFLVGLTAEDAESVEFTDTFFSTYYRDSLYCNKRENAVIMVVSGRCGANGEFLTLAGGHCDIELSCDGSNFIVSAYTAAGKSLEARMPEGLPVNGALAALQQQSSTQPFKEREIIRRASELVRTGKVTDEFWAEIADRCISCTSCNLVCPTCTCFEVLDLQQKDELLRCRMWDSCQLGGFMCEASGHNPLGTQAARARRRIHHKLAADVERWGHITCYLCGRCDEACPTGIGMKAVCREIVAKFG